MSENDMDLLRHYARERSEESFAAIVEQYLGLVYSAALRQVGSAQLAEEVAQSVFTDLALNAHRLAPDSVLAAWLYQVARRTAMNVVRREARRKLREQFYVEMNAINSTPDEWKHIQPHFDDAMDALDKTSRTAILLRYFQNKSLREVGLALGTSDDAAQKRIGRALEKLRRYFQKRGVASTSAFLADAISANSI